MATIAKVVKALQSFGDRVWTVEWAALTQATADAGEPFQSPGGADRSVQVIGTFGAGGSLRFEGSNETEPVNWHVLTDPQGNDLNISTAKVEAITEVTRWVRPRITAGDGSTSLTCILLARRPE